MYTCVETVHSARDAHCASTTVAQDLGLVECCFTSAETVGLLGTGAQNGHLDFHTAPELGKTLERR